MRPFVHVVRTGFGCFLPTNVRHAAGAKHAHDLVHGNIAELFRNYEVHKVVNIGQVPAVEGINRHRAVESLGMDMLPGLLDVLHVSVEAVHEIAFVGVQFRRQLPIPAA